jgi:16S rRNA A1518/A1519 N6-dimethyltransferase RsmA/KsgA/DIM1 with predicted DNA glycosylase/AP lyase activity
LLYLEQNLDGKTARRQECSDSSNSSPSSPPNPPSSTASGLQSSAFSKFLHRGFANPRKMLNKAFPTEVLTKANIDPSARPENLTFEDWVRLYQVVK